MPYLAQRRMRIMGTDYVPGERVPAQELGVRSLRSLLGRGYLVEVDAEAVESEPRGKQAKRVAAGG